MAIYETHCHLNHPQFDADCDQVIARSAEANVRRLLVVSYDIASSRRALSLSQANQSLIAAVGIHPEDAAEWTESSRNELITLCTSNRRNIVAWGEIGLDYHWKTYEPAYQKQVFIEQLSAARELGLPVIIHCRDAYDDTLDLLERTETGTVVMHCFAGTTEQADRAAAMGCYFGIGGVVTYKNAGEMREVAARIPLDRLLLETDSPFLAPVPWRGKRNEPAYLSAVVAKLAEVRQTTVDEIERTTWSNAERLFG